MTTTTKIEKAIKRGQKSGHSEIAYMSLKVKLLCVAELLPLHH